MSLPSKKDDLIALSVGGAWFDVKRSVLTAEPDSMLGAMFGGDWDESRGGAEEDGARILKGVRPELFQTLLASYLQPKADENKYELDPQPHPLVKGDRAEAYRKMLIYLGMNKAAEESIGETFDADALAYSRRVTIPDLRADLFDGGATITVHDEPSRTVCAMPRTCYTPGERAEIRLKLHTPAGLLPSEAFREEDDDGDNTDAPLHELGVVFLPNSSENRNWGGNDDRMWCHKSYTQLNSSFQKNIFENSIVRINVETSGAVSLTLEGEEEQRVSLGRIDDAWGEGVFRFAVSLDKPGLWVTILPPKGAQSITI